MWRYAEDPRFRFDARVADAAVRFFPAYLRHSKGEHAGLPFELEAWQADDIVRPIFGWKWADGDQAGTRVIRTVYIEVPRKNGKSTMGAGLALALLVADGEPGAEVYSAAADREQARLVFDEASRMVVRSPELAEILEPYRAAILCPKLQARYSVLSSDAATKHGLNPHGVVFDEAHAQRNRDLYDVLQTGMAARRQPLMIVITTAGRQNSGICWELHEYALKVRDGLIDDPSFLGVIYAAEQDDDWTDPKVWAKANPNLGVSVKLQYLEQECRKAQDSPAYQNTFRNLHLNQWVEQSTRWLDLRVWDEGAGSIAWRALEEYLKGRRCFSGLDLSSTTDLSALVHVFPPEPGDPTWYVLPRFWCPKAGAAKRAERDRAPYLQWAEQGALTLTDGNVIDYRLIRNRLEQDRQLFQIEEVPYDPWNATQLALELQDEDFNMVEFRQGFNSMAAPTREFERLVVSRNLAHGGHPVLRNMARVVAVRMDPAGNMKPDKAESGDRIDGIVATVMGIGRAIASPDVGEDPADYLRSVVMYA